MRLKDALLRYQLQLLLNGLFWSVFYPAGLSLACAHISVSLLGTGRL